MDTSNSSSSKDFRVYDLQKSWSAADSELAEKVQKVMATLIEKLKPVLRYLTVPVPVLDFDVEENCNRPNLHIVNPYSGHRAIELFEIEGIRQGTVEMLFLREDGKFFTAIRCPFHPHQMHYHGRRIQQDNIFISASTWELAPFEKLIASLNGVLRQAEEKRQQHLQSIRERREKLDEILEIIKK